MAGSQQSTRSPTLSPRRVSHLREYGKRRFITIREHMLALYRARSGVDAILTDHLGRQHRPTGRRAGRDNPAHAHPEHGYRACLGLMRLVRRDGNERVSAACKRATRTSPSGTC